MSILLDTNLLTRLAQQTHPDHDVALRAIMTLRMRHVLCIVPQNLYEFWAVCTRPIAPNNGLGLTVEQTKKELARARSLFTLMQDTPAIFTEWEKLVSAHDVKGKSTHDARLVAAMNVHGIKELLTADQRDFVRYPGITLLPLHQT